MEIPCFFFLFMVIQGHDCFVYHVEDEDANANGAVKYVVNGESSVCILEASPRNFLKCVDKPIDNDLVFDYNIKNGMMYFFSSPLWPFVSRSASNDTRNVHCINTTSTTSCEIRHRLWDRPDFENVIDIALDWTKSESVFVIDRKGERLVKYKLPLHKTNQRKSSWSLNKYGSIDPKQFAESAGLVADKVTFLGLQLDPYNKFLFVQMHIEDGVYSGSVSSSTVILRLEFKTGFIRLKPETRFSNVMKFYVDVSELKVYILDKGNLFLYDYEGKELEKWSFVSENINNFVVFRNIMHYSMYYRSDNVNHIVRLDLNELPNQWGTAVPLYGGEKTFMLLDARSKRQMINGTYVCDRDDCAEECTVLPSGDTCVCRRSRARAQDERTCYECGQSNLTSPHSDLAIVRGLDTFLRDFPWHTTLYELQDGLWTQICGGTLITTRVVLSAAHCVCNLEIGIMPEAKAPETLMVVFGNLKRKWNESDPSLVRRNVKTIIPHYKFMGISINYAHDIALLIMEQKVDFNRHVMPACLDYNSKELPPYETLEAYVPGFGLQEECPLGNLCSAPSTTLKYVQTKVMNFKSCIKDSQQRDMSTFLMLTPDRFCIGSGTDSPVQKGDSGGGLTLVHMGLHYVAGVVSVKFMKHNGSETTYSYGACTDISYHMEWLKQTLPEGE